MIVLKKPNEKLTALVTYVHRSCAAQSHYREVPRWDILMEQELRFGLDFGRLVTEKKGLGR